MLNSQHTITIRPARATDERALLRLAALDCAAPIGGAALVAEVQDIPVAAVDVRDGRLVADPFQATAAVADLLMSRRRQVATGLTGRAC